jgi:tetratricopeptide (TPR) repeat protein
MIKLILFILVAFTSSSLPVDNTKLYTLPVLRQEFLTASKDEDAAKRFYEKMNAYSQEHPVKIAYKAVSGAVMAKYTWNAYSKLKYVNTALDTFERAVAMDVDNPEIRFLRFTLEFYIPRYLGLSSHLQEDKRIVIEGLKKYSESGMSVELARAIKDFMLTKDHCSESEKKELRNIRI